MVSNNGIRTNRLGNAIDAVIQRCSNRRFRASRVECAARIVALEQQFAN